MKNFSPPMVISIHGIRTHARWQKELAEILADRHIRFRLYDYDFFGIAKFLLETFRKKKIEQFYDYYQKVIAENRELLDPSDYTKRPSIIAHSFGSYIVGYCMQKYRDVKFDKIILCGSILPNDFDWATIIGRDQANFIRNECGLKDFWCGIVEKIVPKTGSSGKNGFNFVATNFAQEHFEYYEHSDYFHRYHIEKQWLPFLERKPSNLSIVHGKDMTDFSNNLDKAHQIDLSYYEGLPHYSEIDLPRGLSLQWINTNPDIYTFLFDRKDKTVKGYINAMPIDEDKFKYMKDTGDINDKKIKEVNIIPFRANQQLNIYLMSIAIASDTLNTSQGLFQGALEKLIYGFIYKLIGYARDQNIKVREFLAVAWTDKGKRLCKMFGMQEVNKDEYGNPIYWIDLEDKNILKQKTIFPGIRKLLEIYQNIK